MSGVSILMLGFAGILALLSALVSGTETAIFSLSDEKRRALRRDHPAAGRRFERLMQNPRRTLNTLLLADSLCNLPLIFIALLFVSTRPFGPRFPDWIVAAVFFAAVILFCELLPKILAVARPSLVSRLGGGIADASLGLLARPAEWMENLSDRLLALFGPPKKAATMELGVGEFLTLVELQRHEGALLEAEARMIRELVKLGGEDVTHCMTPRVDTFGIPDDLENDAAAALLRKHRYHRVLVHGESPDDLVGLLDVEAFLLRPDASYIEQIQPPAFVSESMGALELLQSFLRQGRQTAVIVDEFGGVEGIVTISDLIEELIGDEGSAPQSELHIERLGEYRYLVSGSVPLDDLGERLDVDLEHPDIDTLGGLLIEHAGHLPRPGACVSLPGWNAIIRRATRKRIKEVLLEKALPPETEEQP